LILKDYAIDFAAQITLRAKLAETLAINKQSVFVMILASVLTYQTWRKSVVNKPALLLRHCSCWCKKCSFWWSAIGAKEE